MEQLQKDYAEKDVKLFLFPCNQFLFQEPDTNAKIKAFASGYLNISKGSNVVLFSKSGCNKECHKRFRPMYYLVKIVARQTIQFMII